MYKFLLYFVITHEADSEAESVIAKISSMVKTAYITALKRRLEPKIKCISVYKASGNRISTTQFEHHQNMKVLFILIAFTSARSMTKPQSSRLPAVFPAVFPTNIGHYAETEVLQRQKRSCFSKGKILNFRNALRKTNMKLNYKQMVQLIHNHAICVNGICIACGENYVYKIERQ